MPALIGLDQLHYALLITDDVAATSAVYGTPVRIPGAIQANINPNSAMDTLFGDNGPMETATSLGKIELDLEAAEFAPDIQAAMLGHSYISGMLIKKGGDIPPWLAVGGRAMKSNGAYRYFWLVKGKMSDPEEKNETKKDKVSFSTPTMKGNFVKRDCDDIWIVEYDTDSAFYQKSVEDAWFTKVMAPDDIPLGCTVTPLNNATGVAINSNITVVFSKDVTSADVVVANFTLAPTSGGTAVTCTAALSTDKRTVTITPSAALTAATQYTFTVKSATGLASDFVTKFTTA